MNRKALVAANILLVAVFLLLNTSCNRNRKLRKPDAAFAPYITAYTGGIVSAYSDVKIRFADEVADTTIDLNKGDLFTIYPKVEGKLVWADAFTLQFKPDKPLDADEIYDIDLKANKLLKNLPAKLKTFSFSFKTIKQSISTKLEGIRVYDKSSANYYRAFGKINLADNTEQAKIQKTITAKLNGKELKVKVEPAGDRVWTYSIDSIPRTATKGKLEIAMDGDAIDADESGNANIDIPATGVFSMIMYHAESDPDQHVSLYFSEPLSESQDLSGLVNFQSFSALTSFVVDNELRVFPQSRQTGSQNLLVNSAVLSAGNQTLGKNSDVNVTFEEIKPAVKIKGKGVIIPNSNGLILPFQAVNLNAVDVEVFKIYENNVRQFFQVNNLDGSSELYRVGKRVIKKKIPLAGVRNTWTDYSLDLADLVKSEPGAIYRVKLTFKKEYSTYDCADSGTENTGMASMNEEDAEVDESENYNDYDYYSDYDWNYGDDYDYMQRDNPCNSAYYNNSEHYDSRNVLASDLGLTAKLGPNGTYNIYVTHLITTQPMGGVVIEVYDFVNQRLGTATTDGQGMAKLSIPKKKPFLLIAKSGKQRGYLKLGSEFSLSQSNFDVGGEQVQKGIKGFIYGERGVWRPGDSLHIAFMLEDKNNVLPPKHPVTFELVNPRGQIVQKMMKVDAVGGIYDFSTATDDNAPTGTYTARVKVGGATFTQGLKVETIQPNRLKINLDFGKTKLTQADANLQAPLKVSWLNGATARGLRANVSVTLNKAEGKFDNLKDFVFDDPTISYYPEAQTIFDGYLDDNGVAAVQPAIKATNAPAMLTAGFTVRVFEEGGNFSIDRFNMPFYPYTNYVGLQVPKSDDYYGMLPNNKDHTIKVVTADANGKPVSGRKVRYEVYKLEWRWWFDESELGGYNFMNSNYKNLVDSATAYSTGGYVNFKLKLREPNWGRYLIRVKDMESGHTAGQTVYVDYADMDSRQGGQAPEAATMLSFTTDKPKYNVGEEATVTIPSSPGGRALVSIENGSGVVNSFWKELGKGQTVVKFKVTENMTPNVYVNISLIQPHSQAINDLPIRLYGIQPILVEDKNTHIYPMISSAETFRPGETAKITVKEKNGKPMTYTLAIVDEGLLDLTRYKTPDPWNTFYAREALGVRTYDVFDNVLGAYGASLGKILSIGGDGEMDATGNAKESVRAKRFKPMVVYVGPTTLSKGGSKTHTIKIPEYVGSARIMVVARDGDAYGNAEKTVTIKKPLMVLATLPRVLGPNETVKLPVSVFAMENKVKNVTVQLKADPAFFTVEGSTTQNLTFSKIGDQLASFSLKVKPNVGIAKVQVIATGGGETATSTIEIDVRNPNPPVTEVTEYLIAPGKSVTASVKPVGMDKTNKMQLELSTMPPINLGKRLRYLITYPHGCIEQTTSSAFPQLVLGDIMNLDDSYAKSIQTNVKAAISRLRSFQVPSGGFSYWPGESTADEWGTTYAGHFLLEAEARGYQLPVGMLENWKRYQKKHAVEWTVSTPADNYWGNRDLMQAYRLYTLALAKAPEPGAMNKLRETKSIGIAAKWRLAAAYQLSGNSGTAAAIINGLSTAVPKYTEWGNTYGSSDRDEAMILETLTLMDRRVQATPVAKKVSALLGNNNYWMSTQSTAYCLLAMGKYAGKNAGAPMQASYTLNGKAGKAVPNKKSMFLTDVAVAGTKPNSFVITNTGKSMLFVRVMAEGVPAQGTETKAENNLRMNVTYKTLGGRAIDVGRLEQGTDFVAEVTITHPGILSTYENMALNQIFPSGWEIHNNRMDDVSSAVSSSPSTYEDIRDDRVYTYFNIGKNQTLTYKVILNAAYLGRFYLPLVYTEAMYDNSITARLPGRWVEVVAPGSNTTATAKK